MSNSQRKYTATTTKEVLLPDGTTEVQSVVRSTTIVEEEERTPRPKGRLVKAVLMGTAYGVAKGAMKNL